MKKLINFIVILFVAFLVLVFNQTLLLNHINQARQAIYKKTIVFIPGLNLHADDYKSLINKLTTDHYRVITYSSKDTKTTDYQMTVTKWTHDVGEMIGDKQVIVIGHSVGGAVATHFCSIDKRCIAGINLDGGAAFNDKLSVPFLYIQADAGSYCDNQCFSQRALMEKITAKSGTKMIHISGIKHYNFTDIRTSAIKNQDYLGSIDGRNYIYANIHTFLKEIH